MTASNEELKEFCERNLGVSSKVIGGLVAAGSSLATGVPLAAPFLAPVIASSIERVGKEIIARQLGPRQELRATAVYSLTIEKLRELRESGKNIRADGFVDTAGLFRCSADEMTEATLKAAMNSYQERKLPFLANVLANVLSDASVDPETAHVAVKFAEEMSLREIYIICVVSKIDTLHLNERPESGPARSNWWCNQLSGNCI